MNRIVKLRSVTLVPEVPEREIKGRDGVAAMPASVKCSAEDRKRLALGRI